MTWIRANDPEPYIKIYSSGQIHWNGATHIMLGNPLSIELFAYSDLTKIGIRGVYHTEPLIVARNDDGVFVVDAANEIESLGIIISQTFTAVPSDFVVDELPTR
ncbi:MAG: hypothetical protein V3S69_07010 [Dehalococcoidales bacterium]